MPRGGARHGPPPLPPSASLLSNRSLGEGLWSWDKLMFARYSCLENPEEEDNDERPARGWPGLGSRTGPIRSRAFETCGKGSISSLGTRDTESHNYFNQWRVLLQC